MKERTIRIDIYRDDTLLIPKGEKVYVHAVSYDENMASASRVKITLKNDNSNKVYYICASNLKF